jgi:hypothetical protein
MATGEPRRKDGDWLKEGLEAEARRPVLTTDPSGINSVLMNTYPSLHPKPDFDAFYCAYIKGDAAKEPIMTGESIPAIIAKAAEKTGRPRSDFEVEEISHERHEKLKRFLV